MLFTPICNISFSRVGWNLSWQPRFLFLALQLNAEMGVFMNNYLNNTVSINQNWKYIFSNNVTYSPEQLIYIFSFPLGCIFLTNATCVWPSETHYWTFWPFIFLARMGVLWMVAFVYTCKVYLIQFEKRVKTQERSRSRFIGCIFFFKAHFLESHHKVSSYGA